MKSMDLLSHAFILYPILLMLVFNLCSHAFARKRFFVFAAIGAAAELLLAIAVYTLMELGNIGRYNFTLLWEMTPGAACFEITQVKCLLLFVIGVVASVSVMIAKRTIDMNRSSYTNLLMVLILGMNGMLLVTDLFSLYVFMEVTGISSFVMISMFRSRSDLEGAFKYLVLSEIASVLILMGLAFVFMKTGTLNYYELDNALPGESSELERLLTYFASGLILSGFCIKAGAVPFHNWLPDAHQSADTSVSVLLSGIVIKIAGIYGIIIAADLFDGISPIRTVIAIIGMLSIVVGALLALSQHHFKRVIAYSSVSQMGYIMLGISTGTTLGMVGAVAHIFSHAMFKSTLFANAAALHEQAGTLELDELGGLGKNMPVTSATSVIAFLSTAGIPPMAGFWSKLIIIIALVNSGSFAIAAAALCSSIFTAAYFLRLQKRVFFGERKAGLENVRDIDGSVRFAQIALTVITVAAGIFYPAILVYLSSKGLI